MKRTEMVILMQKALEKWQEENPDGGSFYDAMSFVLKKQEDAGIYPPDRFIENASVFSSEWELEDV